MTEMKKPTLRQIQYGYDPVGIDTVVAASFDRFAFFETGETQDSTPLNPGDFNVPWWSFFQGCRQSKHWDFVEEQVEHFLTEIRKERYSLPTRFPYDKASPWSKKEKALMETAVLCSIYMFPEGSARRAGMIGTLLLMAFVHDDVIEFFPDEEMTVIDGVISDWPTKIIGKDGSQEHKIPMNSTFAQQVLDEDKVLGEELLRGLLAWIRHTHGYSACAKPTFKNLNEYLLYRFRDVGIEFIVALVKFSYDAKVSTAETYVLSKFIHLWQAHISLVNDLYSYDKELKDAETQGATLFNAVHILRESKCLTVREAKVLARSKIKWLEHAMYEESSTLQMFGGLNDGQSRLLRGLLECAAGNIFYSAVQGRYGGEGSLLH